MCDNDHQIIKKELTMILMYLSCNKWKNYEFGILNELSDKGYIYQGVRPSKCKSVTFTDDGIEYAKQLLKKYDIADIQEDE